MLSIYERENYSGNIIIEKIYRYKNTVVDPVSK